jgi:cobalt-zinc-cadmium efflux system membrane fusion protein
VKAKPGDRVEKGQVLALLKSVQLGEARAEIAQAEAALDVAKDRLKRQELLMDAEIGAQKSYVEAQGAVKQAQAALSAAFARAQVYGGGGGSGSTTVVRSPLDGTVVERHATAGEVASPDQQLFVIADIDPVWVVARAYESELGLVRVGMTSTVRVKAYPDRTWEGTIGYVSPTLDERSRTAEVRVELPNPDGALKPGMFATLAPTEPEPEAGAAPAPLAVPSSAIQRDGERFLVFVPKRENEYEVRSVTVGKRGAEYVEILGGLEDGEPIVVQGTFILKSEAAKHEMGGGHSH